LDLTKDGQAKRVIKDKDYLEQTDPIQVYPTGEFDGGSVDAAVFPG
jgi:hypothetical protein